MSENQRRIGRIVLQVNGGELPADVLAALDEVVVEDDLAQPAMFTLRFNDPAHALLDGGLLGLGAEVKIAAAAGADGTPRTILAGEITALEPSFEQRGKTLTVRGYDRSHRLHRGRATRTFVRQSDADIVGQIARAQGLKPEVEGGGGQLDYLIQHNQTDMQFLAGRAARLGYRVAVEEKTLRFRRPERAAPVAPALSWGSTLLTFRARLSAVAQPNEVQVRGWDPKAKRAIVGKASRPAPLASLTAETDGGKAAATAFGAQAQLTVTDRLVRSQAEADSLAQAVLDERCGDFLAAEGSCVGEPALRAGCKVELQGIGKALSGSYIVTATRHTYSPQAGYQTTFFVNGRRAGGLLAALAPEPTQPAFAGVVVGIVTNVNDPDTQGRVKLRFPWLDDKHESDWARVASAGGGPRRGLCVTPEIDDEVLVAFEQGDPNRPFVLGGLWNGKDAPPIRDAVKSGKVERRGFTTRAGHSVSFSDEAGKGAITIKTAGGQTIVLEDQPPGKLTISCGGDVQVSGAGGALSIAASGVELSSKGRLTISATGDLSISGALVKIN